MQNFNVKVGTYENVIQRNNGQVHVVEGSNVEYVGFSAPHHITYQKYTKNYSKMNDRPYVVVGTGRGYATLDNAVRAMFKHGFAPL